MLDCVTGAKDCLAWSGGLDGRFTVKSAYELVSSDEVLQPNMDGFYRRVWGIMAPERVRIFLWLIGNQALMTNMERHRHHLCESAICQVCKGGIESTIHILRDCPAMSGIWARIVPVGRRREFFTKTLLEWVYGNLGNHEVVDGVPWSLCSQWLFGGDGNGVVVTSLERMGSVETEPGL